MHGLRELKQHNSDATNARIYRAALERALAELSDKRFSAITVAERVRPIIQEALED